MNATKAQAIKKVKTDVVERMSNNADIGSANEEKDLVIERYEKVLCFLKGVEISHNDLDHIRNPLDELESYLKHIPNGPLFNDIFPTEIKDQILSLSSPCDTNAFIVASVCEDWKTILEDRFKEQKMIFLSETDKPAELMEAAAAHKLDVHLVIDKPVIEVDSKLVTEALTSVSKFTITSHDNYVVEILSDDQFNHLFASIEKCDKIIDEVNLINLDLACINQDTLVNCFVKKIKKLTLEESHSRMLDGETFVSKLLQDSANQKLSCLTFNNIGDFQLMDDESRTNVVNALCKVEHVKLSGGIDFTSQMVEALVKNILEKPIVMKTLIIDTDYVTDFEEVCSPQDLKTVFIKIPSLRLDGYFTEEQLKTIRSLPHVQVEYVINDFGVEYYVIKKGSSECL